MVSLVLTGAADPNDEEEEEEEEEEDDEEDPEDPEDEEEDDKKEVEVEELTAGAEGGADERVDTLPSAMPLAWVVLVYSLPSWRRLSTWLPTVRGRTSSSLDKDAEVEGRMGCLTLDSSSSAAE